MGHPRTIPFAPSRSMTGLSVDTLRAWERRYEAVVPARDDRGRVYTDAHVQRLKQLAALVEQGHAIGRIAGLSDASLARLRHVAGAAARARRNDRGPRAAARRAEALRVGDDR